MNDYDVVVNGVAHMLDRYQDRLVVTELDANEPVADVVDIALTCIGPRRQGACLVVLGALECAAYPRSGPILRAGGNVKGRVAIAERRPEGAPLTSPTGRR